MGAKDLTLRRITAREANAVIKANHYSGKVVQNSQIHIGVYYMGKLEGAMQFGPSLDKRKMLGLVSGTAWDGFLELNRMGFSDALPRNSESRAIAIAMKLIKTHAPKVEWVVSFADGTQCGDGTIYRASGFVLTGLRESKNLVGLPDGSTMHKMTLESNPKKLRDELGGRSYFDVTGGRYNLSAYVAATGGRVIPGFQLRYLYFVNRSARARLTVDEIPFYKIDEVGARMYKGARPGSIDSDAPGFRSGEDGANPIAGLDEVDHDSR